jgi:DNA-binding PadR family transcriptional regulator
MAKRKFPNNREAVILSVLINGERYGREIRDEYEKCSGDPMPLGSLYTTLDRMEQKGYVASRLSDRSYRRGGNRRRYFRITADGSSALDALAVRLASLRGVFASA